MGFIWLYHLVLCCIAMENSANKWRYIAGKIIYKTPKICHGLLTFSNEFTIWQIALLFTNPRVYF